MLHRQTFEVPQVKQEVAEISIDGGKVRLRTKWSQPCEWKDYKAVNLHSSAIEAFFQDNFFERKQICSLEFERYLVF